MKLIKLLFAVTILMCSKLVLATPIFQEILPNPQNYNYNSDFNVLGYSGMGDVSALIEAVDLDLGLGNSSTSGCESSDFLGFTPGRIALLQRGVCTFQIKASLAEAAGAVGVIIFNQGDTSLRLDTLAGTLTDSYTGSLVALGISYNLGEYLSNQSVSQGVSVRISNDIDFRAEVPSPGMALLTFVGVFSLLMKKRHSRS